MGIPLYVPGKRTFLFTRLKAPIEVFFEILTFGRIIEPDPIIELEPIVILPFL